MKPFMLAALLCGGMAVPATAQAQDYVLALHHALAPTSATHVTFLQPWADRIFEQSEGRLLVEIHPSMGSDESPDDLYAQVIDGAIDLAWTVTGNTPGTFTRSTVFTLPFVHQNSAVATNQAIQDVYDAYLAPDFADVHPILVHVDGGQAIHTVDRPVHALADVAGLRLTPPSHTGAWIIEAMGAEPVSMPVSQLPNALAKVTVDGTLMPYEAAVPLNVHELTGYSVEGADGLRFGATVFVLAMNKDSYEALPSELKAVIDANSGAAIAAEVGAIWDANELPAREAAVATGSEAITLDEAATAEFEAALEPVQQRWVEAASREGIDGAALLRAAKSAVAAYSD